MPWTPAGSTAVVIAQRFNPTAAGEYQLITRGVLKKEEIGEGSIFTDVLIQVRSEQFHMLLLPEQLQFIPAVPLEEEQQLIIDKLGSLVKSLPVTAYKGLGLNFAWLYESPDGDINRVSRAMFYVEDRLVFSAFGDDNARYGAYLSKDFDGFRMKLDIKPVSVPVDGGSLEHRLQFAFNFHRDLGAGGALEICERLGKWNKVRAEAERIIDAIERRT